MKADVTTRFWMVSSLVWALLAALSIAAGSFVLATVQVGFATMSLGFSQRST